MREYQIQIEPFEYTAIRDITIMRTVNAHAEASVTVQIRDGQEEEYLGMLTGEAWVKITGISGQDAGAIHTVLFHGIVTDFSFSHDSYGTTMHLALASGTVLMDLKPHFRVFQNENTLCASIHEKIVCAYPEGRVMIAEGGGDRPEGVLIQYHETDWEFLKRTAAGAGRCLVPDSSKKGVRYTIGLPEGMKRDLPTDRIRIKLDMRGYMEKTLGGMAAHCRYVGTGHHRQGDLPDRRQDNIPRKGILYLPDRDRLPGRGMPPHIPPQDKRSAQPVSNPRDRIPTTNLLRQNTEKRSCSHRIRS